MADYQTGTASDTPTGAHEYESGQGDWLVVLTLLYFTPTIIAFSRRHHNRSAIRRLNVMLGWSVLGWIASFVWALTPFQNGTGNEHAHTRRLTRLLSWGDRYGRCQRPWSTRVRTSDHEKDERPLRVEELT